MTAIEVDFDVYKALTLKRAREDVSYNDVLREMLGLDAASNQERGSNSGCTISGVHFPEGTRFRVTYKGRTYTAEIRDGEWTGSDGTKHRSPSGAASAITHTNVNGWRFWDVRRPHDERWVRMAALLP